MENPQKLASTNPPTPFHAIWYHHHHDFPMYYLLAVLGLLSLELLLLCREPFEMNRFKLSFMRKAMPTERPISSSFVVEIFVNCCRLMS